MSAIGGRGYGKVVSRMETAPLQIGKTTRVDPWASRPIAEVDRSLATMHAWRNALFFLIGFAVSAALVIAWAW